MDFLLADAIGSIADAVRFALLVGLAFGAVIGFLTFAAYQTWQDRREALALAARRAPARAQGNTK